MTRYRWLYDGEQPPAEPAKPVEPVKPAEPAKPANFLELLPEDLRENPTLAKTKGDIEVLARSHVALQGMVGKSPDAWIEKPGVDDDAPYRTLLSKAGLIPENIDGYLVGEPEGVSENMKLSGELGKKFRETAFSAGLAPKQAEAVYHWFAGEVSATAKAQQERVAAEDAANLDTLKSEFGDAFNSRMAAFDYAVEQLGGDDLKGVLNETGLDKHPAVVKALAKVGVGMSRGVDLPPGRSTAGFGDTRTPAEYREEGEKLLAQSLKPGLTHTETRTLSDKAQKFFDLASKSKG